jgi:hypothetical protein
MTLTTSTPKRRKPIKKWHISTLSIFFNTIALLLRGDFWRSVEANVLYSNTCTYLITQSNTFLDAASKGQGTSGSFQVTTLKATIAALINIIPWGVILIVLGISAAQAKKGYDAWEQENFSGVTGAILSVAVLIFLVIMSSFVTDFLVGNGVAASGT